MAIHIRIEDEDERHGHDRRLSRIEDKVDRVLHLLHELKTEDQMSNAALEAALSKLTAEVGDIETTDVGVASELKEMAEKISAIEPANEAQAAALAALADRMHAATAKLKEAAGVTPTQPPSEEPPAEEPPVEQPPVEPPVEETPPPPVEGTENPTTEEPPVEETPPPPPVEEGPPAEPPAETPEEGPVPPEEAAPSEGSTE